MAQAKTTRPPKDAGPRLCSVVSSLLDGPCPSYARWIGPDGEGYCSMHFIHRFGYRERLVRVEDYEPPRRPKED